MYIYIYIYIYTYILYWVTSIHHDIMILMKPNIYAQNEFIVSHVSTITYF